MSQEDRTDQIIVVIVEDHAVTRDGLAVSLSKDERIRVAGLAGTAAAGKELCGSLHPDIVLLDLHLPDSDNVERLVRDFSALGKHIVVFSAEGRRAFTDAAMRLPIAAYLLKSEEPEFIIETIKRVAAGSSVIVSRQIESPEVNLTAAEKDLLRLLGQVHKYESIGKLRNTTGATVKKQCERLLIKLDLLTREELISWAALHGYANLNKPEP